MALYFDGMLLRPPRWIYRALSGITRRTSAQRFPAGFDQARRFPVDEPPPAAYPEGIKHVGARELTEQHEDVALTATANNLLKDDVGRAVSVLQIFRANAQRTLDELRAKNTDPALIEGARKALDEAGESLQRLVATSLLRKRAPPSGPDGN